VRIPGQILTFIWFAEEDISKIQHLSYVSGDTPSLYAMIEILERPLTVAKTYDRVVVGGSKQLTTNEFHERRRNGMSLTAPNLCLVPVDTIYLFFLRHHHHWSLGHCSWYCCQQG
jgi:hypothetical protein